MPADLSKLVPIIDMLAKSGDLTTEWKAARSTGRIALILFVVGLLGTVAGCVSDGFGGSKLGIIAGGLATFAGVVTQVIGQLGYTTARTAVKTQAKQLADTVVKTVGDVSSGPTAPPIATGPTVQTVQ